MKKITKLGTMALVGIMGMGLATTPVSAAPAQKTTEVFYTTSSAGVDADGKVVMVVPASLNLTKENAEKEFAVTMQASDPNGMLPEDFKATVKVESSNKGKLKNDTLSKAYDYQLLKGEATSGNPITLTGGEVEFNQYQASNGDTHAIEQKATAKVEKDSIDKMEVENPGTVFKDTLTFKVSSFSGTGLNQK